MPLDPSIILGGKPVQTETPLAAYGQVMATKNMQLQNQAAAQKVQSGELELEQQRRVAAYQKTFSEAVRDNTAQNPDGTLKVNWGNVSTKLTNAGFGDKAIALNGDIAEAQKKALDLAHSQMQGIKDKAEVVGQVLGALPTVDPKAPADVFGVQKAAFGGAAISAVKSLAQQGVLPPEEAAQYAAQIQQSGGWSPEIQSMVDQKKMAGMSIKEQTEYFQHAIEAQRQGKLTDAQIANLKSETATRDAAAADKARSDAAALVSQATSGGDYLQRLSKIDKAVAQKLPALKDLDFAPDKLAATQEKILTSGMNSEQLAQHQIAKNNSESLVQSRAQLEIIRQQNADIRQQLLDGKPSPAAKAAATKIDYLEKVEAPLWTQASQLSSALSKGDDTDIYVEKSGNVVSLASKTQAAKNEEEAGRQKAQLIDDMQTRFQAVKDQLKGVLNRKYDAAEGAGSSPVVTRDEALKGIEELGKGKSVAAPPAAPAPAAKPAAPAAKPAAPVKKFTDPQGHTWEEGQTVYMDGKPHKLTGMKDGKPVIEPITK